MNVTVTSQVTLEETENIAKIQNGVGLIKILLRTVRSLVEIRPDPISASNSF